MHTQKLNFGLYYVLRTKNQHQRNYKFDKLSSSFETRVKICLKNQNDVVADSY